MNTLDYHQLNIGLPEAPLWLGVQSEGLDRSEVCLLLNTKNEIQGRLCSFSFYDKYLICEHDRLKEKLHINFSELSYLYFIQSYRFNIEDVSPVFRGGGVELPSWDEPFLIHLKSGDVLEGEMNACLLDDVGIHIFKNENNYLRRYFIPHASVDKSKLGKKIGDLLLSRNVVKAKQISQALHDQNIFKNKKIGEFLLDRKVISKNDLDKVLGIQDSIKKRKNTDVRIGDLLVQEEILTEKDFNDALKAQKQKRSAKIGDILIDMGYASDLEVHRVLSNKLGVPLILVKDFNVNTDVIKNIPFEIALKHSVFPLDIVNDRLLVTFNDPLNNEAIAAVQKLTDKIVELAISPKKDIDDALASFYGSFVIENNIEELEKFHFDSVSEYPHHKLSTDTLFDLSNSQSVVNVMNNILQDAMSKGVKDIYIRPQDEKVDLLYRLDNKLAKQQVFHKGLLQLLVGRLKVMGDMDISENNQLQSGISTYKKGGEEVNLMISVIPTITGESVVIRLTSKSFCMRSIQELGFSDIDLGTILGVLNKDRGIIVVAGPRHSGKTLTIYAGLRELSGKNLNIITIEDPVEQYIREVEQIDLSSISGESYAKIIRHTLIHDPDVIMISELFDADTAKLIINRVAFQHLVLVSMEVNNFNKIFDKLSEMGVSEAELSENLSAILVQHLANKNCQHCLEIEDIDSDIRKNMQVNENEIFFHGIGCDLCNGLGYNGKILIYELIKITDKLRTLIANKINIYETYQNESDDEFVSLSENALEKARLKIISLKEAYKIMEGK